MSKVLILGAAGRIPQYLIPKLLKDGHEIVLYARNANERLVRYQHENIYLIDGDINNKDNLTQAMQGVDIIYVNAFHNKKIAENIKQSMKENNVKRVVVASVLGIYGEVIGEFGKWNENMVGNGIPDRRSAVEVLEKSSLDYTILRLTWLYDDDNNEKYEITKKGEPFKGAQVTRQAVAQLVTNIIKQPSLYSQSSIGVNEPNTYFDKPLFM